MLDVSTRTLRTLIALDETRHFSLATEHCSITQSALSQAIGKLEQQIGLRLVDRDRRRVNFTGEGERIVAAARRVVLELDEISHDLREYAALRKGRVVIAAQPSLAAHWLPPTITQFKALYPGVSVGLFDAAPDRALELVRQRLADVALTAKGPGMVGLQHRLLFHDRFVVVCPRSHPLGRRKALTLKDLAGHPFIRLIGTNLSRPIYLVWPSAAQLNPAMQAFVDLLKYPPSLKPLGESLIN